MKPIARILLCSGMLLLVPGSLAAQSADRAAGHLLACAPERIAWQSVFFFGPFSPGGATDLPAAERKQLVLIDRAHTDQHFVFQGTADTLDWQHTQSQKRTHLANFTVGEARASWARELVGRGVVVDPLLRHQRRGVYVYSYTCQERVGAGSGATTADLQGLRADLMRQLQEMRGDMNELKERLRMATSTGWHFATGGVAVVSTGSPFITPALGVVLAREFRAWQFEAELLAGWRPAGNAPEGATYQTGVCAEARLFPRGTYVLGLAVSLSGHWENVDDGDTYLRRVYGAGIGPTFALGPVRISAQVLGLRANSWGAEAPEERLGASSKITFIF